MTKYKTILTLLFLAVFAAGFAGFAVSSKTQTPPQDSRQEVQAARRGGLREVARIKGKYVARIDTGSWIKYDIEGLTKNSYAIVIGTPLTHSSRLTADGESIVTEYELRVDETVKGNLYQTQTTKVEIPGGKVVFEDGSTAEIEPADLLPMEKGKTYLLFLRTIASSPNSFALTGQGQGLFEVTSEKRVKPHGNKADLVQKHGGQQVPNFLQLIRDAVKKYPSVSEGCCN